MIFFFHEIQFNYYYETALFIAIKKKNKEMVKLLLNHPKIDINVKLICHTLFSLSSHFLNSIVFKTNLILWRFII